MSVIAAMEEAYATQPVGEHVIETLELDHETFDAPVRIATNTPDFADINLPLVLDADPVAFLATQVNVTPPGMTADGPTPMRVRVDNVGSLLLPYCRAAIQSTGAISVTYRAYLASDLTQPGEVYSGLELRDVDLGSSAAEGVVGFREIERQAFPLATYSAQYFPGLQGN
jgi:hypothetical protein